MAKMHTRRKGRSGSTRPIRTESPEWSNTNTEEIIETIKQLGSRGMQSSEIGMVLRDRHGVPDVKLLTGKKIVTIMKENNMAPKVPEDLYNLIVKVLELKKHIDRNPKDFHNRRSFNNMESKIRRLGKYYRSEGIIPANWKYSVQRAEMLITK